MRAFKSKELKDIDGSDLTVIFTDNVSIDAANRDGYC